MKARTLLAGAAVFGGALFSTGVHYGNVLLRGAVDLITGTRDLPYPYVRPKRTINLLHGRRKSAVTRLCVPASIDGRAEESGEELERFLLEARRLAV